MKVCCDRPGGPAAGLLDFCDLDDPSWPLYPRSGLPVGDCTNDLRACRPPFLKRSEKSAGVKEARRTAGSTDRSSAPLFFVFVPAATPCMPEALAAHVECPGSRTRLQRNRGRNDSGWDAAREVENQLRYEGDEDENHHRQNEALERRRRWLQD